MGIPKVPGLTIYSLRHSIITRLLDEDLNLYGVQNVAGHKRVETTAQYYHTSLKKSKQVIDADPMNIASLTEHEVLTRLQADVDGLLKKYRLHDNIKLFTNVQKTADSLQLQVFRK